MNRPIQSDPQSESHPGRGTARRLYRLLLWILLAILVAGLVACSAGSGEAGSRQRGGGGIDSTKATATGDVRLLLAGSAIQDSARTIAEFHVDQVLRQVLDSIPGAEYLTLNYRDSLALSQDPSGQKGVALAELGKRLALDGAIFSSVARFGSVLAIELRIVEPQRGQQIFRDIAFSQIRYRDTAGTMLLGPALYDGLSRLIRRFSGLAHTKQQPAAAAPLVLSAFVIPQDQRLGPVAKGRDALSRSVLTAVHDYTSTHFPELVSFDPTSRDRLYETIRVAAVANYLAPGNAERQALYNVGIDHFLVGSIDPVGADSMRLRLEIRYVNSRSGDSLRLAQEMVQPVTMFSSTAYDEDVTVATLDLAEPLLRDFSAWVAAEYERGRAARLQVDSGGGAR